MSRRAMKRRDAAAGSIAMLVLAAAAAGQAKAEELDGELLALAAEFKAARHEIERQEAILDTQEALARAGRQAEEQIRRIVDRGWEIRDRVADLPAHTPEGLAAKAWVALWEACDGEIGAEPTDTGSRVAWSLARDILGRAGA